MASAVAFAFGESGEGHRVADDECTGTGQGWRQAALETSRLTDFFAYLTQRPRYPRHFMSPLATCLPPFNEQTRSPPSSPEALHLGGSDSQDPPNMSPKGVSLVFQRTGTIGGSPFRGMKPKSLNNNVKLFFSMALKN